MDKHDSTENQTKEETIKTKPIIDRLVLSGGGVWGMSCYGALRESNIRGFWDIKNIKSIYGTSVGAMLAVCLSLQYEWSYIDDYLIDRPWDQIFKFNLSAIVASFQQRGIFGQTQLREIFLPLFKGKDISIDITMAEFVEKTGIELFLYATDLSDLRHIEFSSKTHPQWKLMDALYCSCCLPILFSPFFLSDEKTVYVDGGILHNYPLAFCCNNHSTECNNDSIFGINKNYSAIEPLSTASSLYDVLLYLFSKVNELFLIQKPTIAIKHQLDICDTPTNMYDIYLFVTSSEERKKRIQIGVESFINQLKKFLPTDSK